MIGVPSSNTFDYQKLAKLITPNPPEWLAAQLRSWAPTLFLGRAIEMRQPTRSEMIKMLREVVKSADVLRRALDEYAVREFLDLGAARPIASLGALQKVIDEVHSRAANASKLSTLVNADGKVKAGRSRAVPDSAISAQVYCALLIAETWKWFRGAYPSPRNGQAAEAVDLYWQLAGGTKLSWGENPLNSWRHHLLKASKLPAEKERAEYRRHLNEAATQASR